MATYSIRQAAQRTLLNSAAEQKLFDASPNGRVLLEGGPYFFRCQFGLSGLSATSGNAAFDLLGTGDATLNNVLYHAVGIDGAAGTAAAQSGSTMIVAQSPASIMAAATNTNLFAHIVGTFEVTGKGTIVPSITLVTAAAGIVSAGSYFWCRHMESNASGPWD